MARQNATDVGQTSIPEGFSYERGTLALEQLARSFVPEATAVLANYPNPFNFYTLTAGDFTATRPMLILK